MTHLSTAAFENEVWVAGMFPYCSSGIFNSTPTSKLCAASVTRLANLSIVAVYDFQSPPLQFLSSSFVSAHGYFIQDTMQ